MKRATTPAAKPAQPNKPHPVHVSFKEREYFTENLALLLKSAVPIGQALDSLQATARSRAMKKALSQMQIDIEAGLPLADALERTGIVSGQTLALTRLGEASGHLVENLHLAAQQEEKRHAFQAKVRSALIYPIFVLSLTLAVGLAVAWFLLPRLSATFSQLHVHLPLISRVMIKAGIFLKVHGKIVVPAVLLGLVLLLYLLFAAPGTKQVGRRLLFAVPGVGRLLREVEVAQCGYLLGTLLEAGLPVRQAVELLASASMAPQYQKLYRHLAAALDDGYGFRQALEHYPKAARLLPAATQQMIFAGERSGSLPEVLLTIGRTYEEKSAVTTQNLEAIIEPLLLVVVAAGVLLVAVAVILPVYSLVGGLNQ